MPDYTVESITETRADWGVMYVANIRRRNDVTLYIIGPCYSKLELVQAVLDRFGRK